MGRVPLITDVTSPWVIQALIMKVHTSVNMPPQVQPANLIGRRCFATCYCTMLILRVFNTVFVLVDNRDLTAPRTDQESLAHWPTVEAWWISRLGMHGPAGELCDLIYIPISAAAGLEHVHPTWASTFVLGPWSSCSQVFTLCCWTVIACRSLCLKLLIYGKKCRFSELD